MMRHTYSDLNESYCYQIFNEAAMSADTPLNNATPEQQRMIQDKMAELPTSLADKVKSFFRDNWKFLTVSAAISVLSFAAGYGILSYVRISNQEQEWQLMKNMQKVFGK